VRVDDSGNPRTWILLSPTGSTVHYYARPIQTDDQTLIAGVYEDKLYQVDAAAARIDKTDGIALPRTRHRQPRCSLMRRTTKLLYNPAER